MTKTDAIGQELKDMKEQNRDEHKEIKELLGQVLKQAKETNGRVTKLESNTDDFITKEAAQTLAKETVKEARTNCPAIEKLNKTNKRDWWYDFGKTAIACIISAIFTVVRTRY